MGFPYDSDEPDIFVEHNGVTVYHCYNGDEAGLAHETYEFSLNRSCGNRTCMCGLRCRFQFDVRKLPNYVEVPKPLPVDKPGAMSDQNIKKWKYYFSSQADYHRQAICTAIERGYIKSGGIKLPRGRVGRDVQ
jgi:hypothetical protein